jgi:hypothetical protein
MRGFRVDLDQVGAIAMHEMSEVHKAVATEYKGKLVLRLEPEAVKTHELAQRLRTVLPKHSMPKKLVARPRLPLSQNGKHDTKTMAFQNAVS